jgi:hypothetical protein
LVKLDPAQHTRWVHHLADPCSRVWVGSCVCAHEVRGIFKSKSTDRPQVSLRGPKNIPPAHASPDATMPQGEKGGGAGASGGDAAGGGGGKRRVCCARSGCGEDGQKRCGGCKQVGAE